MDDLPKFVVDDPDDPCPDGKTIVDRVSKFTRLDLMPVELRAPAVGSDRLPVVRMTAVERDVRGRVLDYGFLSTFNDLSWGLAHDVDTEYLDAFDKMIETTVQTDSFDTLLSPGF